ncbi:universal stress protein [uncultured Microbacterium sp.]|uniref:UspA domain protein n=1 Tax=uncultured Microbacterium sp. TaxID=191216 RepID=A0A1Y5P005_9MICO|nr:universal stress protein [uncultured Microbacterium sp.]SBS70880.1 UspA domain protein [uncultured Microbacterium sp.]
MNEQSETIVVGVDGSESSVAALRYAARLAHLLDAPLEAVTTWVYPPYVDYALLGDWSPEEHARTALDEAVAAAFGGEPPDRLTTTTLPGSAADALIGASRNAQMLVLGSRGHGGFAGLLLGSVSNACAAHAHCPVLIVRADTARPDEESASERRAGAAPA